MAYGFTIAPGLSFYDSAELALVAAQGGLGHPVGQPVHTALGWLITRLSPSPWALTFMLSALPVALMVPPLTSLVRRMAPDGPRWIAPGFIACALLHPVVWEAGSRVEVYTLAASLSIWGVAWMMIALETKKGWGIAGVFMGLSAATNPYTALFAAAAAGPALLLALARRSLGLGGIIKAILGGVVGLLPYSYIWLVAGRSDAFVWGAPIDAESLRFYLSGADYAHSRTATGTLIIQQTEQVFQWTFTAGLAPILAMGVVGNIWLGRTLGLGRLYGVIVLFMVATLLGTNPIFDMRIADYPPISYCRPLYRRLRRCDGSTAYAHNRLAALLLVLVVGSVWLSPPSVFERTRTRDVLAQTMAQQTLDDAPQDGVIVVESDHWVWPLLYEQHVNKRRSDVVVLAVGLANSSWYWAWLYRHHPSLTAIELRGPGGRMGRVRRFLEAQNRPTIYEDFGTAVRYGRPACVRRWLVGGPKACSSGSESPDVLDRLAQDLGRGTNSHVCSGPSRLGPWRSVLATGRAQSRPQSIVDDYPTIHSARCPAQKRDGQAMVGTTHDIHGSAAHW